MKKYILNLSIIVLLISITMSSCNKGNSMNTSFNDTANKIKASIDAFKNHVVVDKNSLVYDVYLALISNLDKSKIKDCVLLMPTLDNIVGTANVVILITPNDMADALEITSALNGWADDQMSILEVYNPDVKTLLENKTIKEYSNGIAYIVYDNNGNQDIIDLL